jgi:dTDP-glucose 4,6-dehydratase
MNNPKPVLILGLNSFSGSVTASNLLKRNYKVFGLNRSPEVSLAYRAYGDSIHQSNLMVNELGSNYEPSRIVEICEENGIKLILNFAAQSMVAQSWDSPWDWYQTNCVWLSKLSSSLIKWGKLEKFIHYTTPEVYGSTSGWISEDYPINPSTPYAISRAAGDLHLLAEFRRIGFPVIFTRAANVFGPNQQRYRIIPKALIAAASGQKISLHGGGLSERSFVYMEDVAEALWLIMERGTIGSSYHISTDRLVTIQRAVEMCFELYGKSPDEYLEVVGDRPGKDQAYKLDAGKLRTELGWSDKVSLEMGIDATKKWVDTWLSDLLKEPAEYIHRV